MELLSFYSMPGQFPKPALNEVGKTVTAASAVEAGKSEIKKAADALFDEANGIADEKERSFFQQAIRQRERQLCNMLDNMGTWSSCASQIESNTTQFLSELNSIGDSFRSKTTLYHQKQDNLNYQLEEAKAGIQGSHIDLYNYVFAPSTQSQSTNPLAGFTTKSLLQKTKEDPFLSLKMTVPQNVQSSQSTVNENETSSVQDVLAASPGYWEARENMREVMAVVNVAGKVVGAVNEGLSQWGDEIVNNVKHTAEALCEKNPLFRERCQKLGQLPSSFVNMMENVNDYFDKVGSHVEGVITETCNKNPDMNNKCQIVSNLFKSFGDAVQSSEPQLASQDLIQRGVQTICSEEYQKELSFKVDQTALSFDNIWAFPKGTTNTFLASSVVLGLTTNPFGKGGKLIGTGIKAIPGKGMSTVKPGSLIIAPRLSSVSYLNNNQYKTLQAVFDKKGKAVNLPWKEVEQLFKSLGATFVEGRGAHYKVSLNGIEKDFVRVHAHKHIGHELIKNVRKFLQEAGATPVS